jgi:hypothetical protein
VGVVRQRLPATDKQLAKKAATVKLGGVTYGPLVYVFGLKRRTGQLASLSKPVRAGVWKGLVRGQVHARWWHLQRAQTLSPLQPGHSEGVQFVLLSQAPPPLLLLLLLLLLCFPAGQIERFKGVRTATRQVGGLRG